MASKEPGSRNDPECAPHRALGISSPVVVGWRRALRAGVVLASAPVAGCCVAPTAGAINLRPPVRPQVGRWVGQVGLTRVVFTVQESKRRRFYAVRPVVYCDSTHVAWYENGTY